MKNQNSVAYGLVREVNQELEERDIGQAGVYLEVDISREDEKTILSYKLGAKDVYEDVIGPFEVEGQYEFESEEFVTDEIIEELIEDSFYDSETTVGSKLEQ